MRYLGLVFFVFLLFFACDSEQEKKLFGKWQASALLEDGMPMDVDPLVIGFEFLPNGYYRFNGTLNYKEAGSFKIAGDLLYTIDTINEASSEKAVKITMLTKDSLFIRMNVEGKEQVIKLFKVK
jgi:hypothetical protein